MNTKELIEKAESGDAEAQYELGNAFTFDYLAKSYGVELDHRIAAEWYKRAADQGHNGAQCQLACLYLETIDEDKWREASDLLAKAANKGCVAAMANLGRLFGSGKGVPYSPALAEEWLTRAARKGDGEEKFFLGFLYYYGGLGLQQDYVKAAFWFEKAAKYDHGNALRALVGMYDRGIGVPRNIVKADQFRDRLEQLEAEETGYKKKLRTFPDVLRNLAGLYRALAKNEILAENLLQEALEAEESKNLDLTKRENRERIRWGYVAMIRRIESPKSDEEQIQSLIREIKEYPKNYLDLL